MPLPPLSSEPPQALAPHVCKQFGPRQDGPSAGFHASEPLSAQPSPSLRPRALPSTVARRAHHHAFHLILLRLPTELQLRILALVAPSAVAALQSPGCTLSALTTNLCHMHSTYLFHLTLTHQFPLEASIFPFAPSSASRQPSLWTSPDGISWALCSPTDYLHVLHHLSSLTRIATSTIQRVMPAMRQTALIYEHLLYCWKLLRYAPGDPIHGIWAWFASLPKDTQWGINNFFDNLAGELLRQHAVNWPRRCGCMHAREAQHANAGCRYRIPERLHDEMGAIGVCELLSKQVVLKSVGKLLTWLWNDGEEREMEGMRGALSWLELDPKQTIWNCAANGTGVLSHRCAHVPFAPLVMQVRDEDAYEIWVYGKRGEGRVELRCKRWREDACRMLEAAVRLPPGDALDLGWFEEGDEDEAEGMGGMPSFVVDRAGEWGWEWWGEDIGLQELFAEI